MDKLSELISQARPLYKQRKRRKTILVLLCAITLPAYMITNLTSLYMQGDAIYMSLDNNRIQNELLEDDFGIMEFE